jgi:hypothetical protein
VGEHHLVGVAAAGQLRHQVAALLEGGEVVDPEAVHAQDEAGLGHPLQVVGVVDGVAAVAEDDPAEVDALGRQHLDDPGAVLAGRVRVDGDRHAGGRVRAGDRAEHPLHAGRQPLLVDRALEHARPDAGAGDALGDVADEEVGHRLLRAAGEEERHLVERVDAGGDHDVEVGNLLGDPLDPADVSALADHGDVDDRVDAVLGQLAQLADGVGDAPVLLAPLVGIVLLDVGRHHEDVLVHEHPAELGGLDRAPRRLDVCHTSMVLG